LQALIEGSRYLRGGGGGGGGDGYSVDPPKQHSGQLAYNLMRCTHGFGLSDCTPDTARHSNNFQRSWASSALVYINLIVPHPPQCASSDIYILFGAT
jgi:hypothetical protein